MHLDDEVFEFLSTFSALEELNLSLNRFIIGKNIGDMSKLPRLRRLNLDGTAFPTRVRQWFFLDAVDVVVGNDASAIVAFGDSIIDGAGTTYDTNRRWPDFLARRLQADPRTRHLAVLNHGIGGNRVLQDGLGPNALARFERDVLAQPGVRYLILLEVDGHMTDRPVLAAIEELRTSSRYVKVLGSYPIAQA